METRRNSSDNNQEEDRISNLPDNLIHHIFSFLDIDDAIYASFLSRRWRYLWTSLPTLNFNSRRFFDTGSHVRFEIFVERVLLLRDSSYDVQRLNYYYISDITRDYDITSHFNTLIVSAVRRNVQEISLKVLCLSRNLKSRFSSCLFTCVTLTKLELYMDRYRLEIILPNAMCLPQLKYLKLDGVSIKDEKLTDKLFSSCPVLESLILIESLLNINISSLTLKHFALNNSYYVDASEDGVVKNIKLYAPNLASLSWESYMSRSYSLENLSSLVTANIELMVEEHNDECEVEETFSKLPAEVKGSYVRYIMKLLRALHNVKDLTLSPWFLEVLSRAPDDILDRQPAELCYLRCLKLETRLTRSRFRAIAYLLKNSPDIESLTLVMTQKCLDKDENTENDNEYEYEDRYGEDEDDDDTRMYSFCDEMKFNSTNIGDSLEAVLRLPCMLHRLKFVLIRGVEGFFNELKFLEILLKNAMILEKVVLDGCACNDNQSRYSSFYCSSCCRLFSRRRISKFTEKLQTLPRASSSTEFLFL